MVEEARRLAKAAHAGQYYGTGEPYFIHPTQVAVMAERLGYGDIVIAACYLHGVIEDTDMTEADLRKIFPNEVVEAVLAVTYEGNDFAGKIEQAMRDPVGHVVKFCDAACNLSNTILYNAKPGKNFSEVIFRRLEYLVILKKQLPTPKDIEVFLRSSGTAAGPR